MRTKHIDDLTDCRREPKTDVYCCVCQRDIKDAPKFFAHLVNGPEVLHPDEEAAYVSDMNDLGTFPVGPECARRIGREWLHSA